MFHLPYRRVLHALVIVLGTSTLLACSTNQPASWPRSYVVLLPNPDGTAGEVFVQGSQGTQRLHEPGQGAGTDGTAIQERPDSARLQKDFGAAMAARPLLPEKFMLYFVPGSTRLDRQSEILMPRILDHIKTRAEAGMADVSIVGHTDTVGQPESNQRLSLARANAIANRLKAPNISDVPFLIEYHGESNLLVITPDETQEPLNRRVEVTVR